MSFTPKYRRLFLKNSLSHWLKDLWINSTLLKAVLVDWNMAFILKFNPKGLEVREYKHPPQCHIIPLLSRSNWLLDQEPWTWNYIKNFKSSKRWLWSLCLCCHRSLGKQVWSLIIDTYVSDWSCWLIIHNTSIFLKESSLREMLS